MGLATFWATFFTNSSGTDIMILKIFLPKKLEKQLAVFVQIM
jgi:hypothetical protein